MSGTGNRTAVVFIGLVVSLLVPIATPAMPPIKWTPVRTPFEVICIEPLDTVIFIADFGLGIDDLGQLNPVRKHVIRDNSGVPYQGDRRIMLGDSLCECPLESLPPDDSPCLSPLSEFLDVNMRHCPSWESVNCRDGGVSVDNGLVLIPDNWYFDWECGGLPGLRVSFQIRYQAFQANPQTTELYLLWQHQDVIAPPFRWDPPAAVEVLFDEVQTFDADLCFYLPGSHNIELTINEDPDGCGGALLGVFLGETENWVLTIETVSGSPEVSLTQNVELEPATNAYCQ